VSGSAVAEKPPTNYDRGDVRAGQVANASAAVESAPAVEFAPQGAALDQLERGLCGRVVAWHPSKGYRLQDADLRPRLDDAR
jgi:hypothetical protein